MKISPNLVLLACFCLLALPINGQADLLPMPGSRAYDKVPKGTVTKHTWTSELYTNTLRDYYIYVPAQYDDSQPAALMVFQDGHTYVKEDGYFRAPTVLDNLIAQEKMPITIGLFIDPGHEQTRPPIESPWRASNRSIEYDTLSDSYVKFLEQEVIAALKKDYTISDDPKMHAICGISSGGICAFTAAWQRPDLFHKVLSHIGSFTDIKGGHNYPSLIRSADPKPIKIFLQDGSNDLDNEYGNWFLANQQMAKSLEYKNYNFQFVTDTGAHNGKLASKILPQSLIWLWDDVVPTRLPSQKYGLDTGTSGLLFEGETTHLANFGCQAKSISQSQEEILLSEDHEQVVIVRSGRCQVEVGDSFQEVGPNSVLFIPVAHPVKMLGLSNVSVYHFKMKARSADAGDRETQPFVLNFDSLSYRTNLNGGRRDCFRQATAMFPYFEMHITTLKPGMTSHAAHTHGAEELIIMIEGETEEEIGNEVYQGGIGEMYYLGSHVPHSVKNVGDGVCSYFAFQWE